MDLNICFLPIDYFILLLRVGSTGLLHQQVDILVVTPGRLAHHIRDTPQLDLTALRLEINRFFGGIFVDFTNFCDISINPH